MHEQQLLSGPFSLPRQVEPGWSWLVLGVALVLGSLGAIDHAGGWNDGSRLATVEALVDHHSWCIDSSIFVQVPSDPSRPCPYPAGNDFFTSKGTLDKLFINGHYYSDKSPVPALLLAGQYYLWQNALGLVARERPDRFCWLLTLGSSGLAFGLAVWCSFRLGRPLGLSLRHRLLLAAGLGVSTVAWTYSRQVNNHILLLAAAMAVLVEMAWLAQGRRFQTPWRLLGVGALAGLAYTIDLGAGPILFGLTGLAVAARCRRVSSVAWFTAAALPWLGLHHVLNYTIGGTWKPANAVAEYFLWPGCPFNARTMTGGWHHASIGRFLLYAVELLVGRRGFLLYNLPLLAFAGTVLFVRPGAGASGLYNTSPKRQRRDRPRAGVSGLYNTSPKRQRRDRPGAGASGLWGPRLVEKVEVLLALGWCGGVWLIYAVASTNFSGECCSIRWFVPLLAPGFFLLAVLLRERPDLEQDYLHLSGWGLIMGALMAWFGPWSTPRLSLYGPLMAAALVSRYIVFLLQARQTSQATPQLDFLHQGRQTPQATPQIELPQGIKPRRAA